MTIELGSGLSIPDEAVTQTFGILAKRGAGKSNTAAVMAEGMYDAGLPFVVIDPVGAWWGLRSSADGKSGGLPIPIFGGHRGDVPLEGSGAELIADLIVDQQLSCVVDCSAFESEGQKRRFLSAFAERLFRRKGQPGNDFPLHLFLEEADDYAPQRAGGVDVNRTLGAFQRIVKQGRARGLGSTMITQRSAVLNKDLLTQIETLIVMRTTAPNDRKAISGWVQYHGQNEEILASLHELVDGEGWFWSPWLGTTMRVQFRRRRTFDSGATPSVKKGRRVATLADVDLDALRERMADTIQRAKAEDPRELAARIKQLERTLDWYRSSVLPRLHPSLAPRFTEGRRVPNVVLVEEGTETKSIEVPVVPEGFAEALDEATKLLHQSSNELSIVGDALSEMRSLVSRVTSERITMTAGPSSVTVTTEGAGGGGGGSGRSVGQNSSPEIAKPQVAPIEPPDTSVDTGRVTKSQRKVLDALAWWEAAGRQRPTRSQVGFVAGYRKGGRFNDVVSSCRTAGLIDYPGDGRLTLTPAGRALTDGIESPPSEDQLQDMVLGMLNGSQRRVLEPLIRTYPQALSREALASASGYEVGGRFNDVVSSLRTLECVDYPTKGFVIASDGLFVD